MASKNRGKLCVWSNDGHLNRSAVGGNYPVRIVFLLLIYYICILYLVIVSPKSARKQLLKFKFRAQVRL